MINRMLTLGLLIIAAQSMNAQSFLDGAYRFSGTKEAYVTLNTGETITSFVDDIKRKKGLIRSIELKDAAGKKTTLSPEQVKHMYVAPTGFDNLSRALDDANTISRWDEDKSAHAEYIKQGYVFFETTEVMVKKKKMTMLLQLVNPGFANGIKVYFDPMAAETGGLAVGGMQVTGGDKKSFYFKKGDKTAVKISKKNYEDEFSGLYGGCDAFKKEFAKNKKWSQVEKHVFFYSENCQ
ncbi:MAG: hypothetical protein HUU01_19380 [Saprospiraceae bacterium]|nr:hypothetical protein [Saprospiraceae bacterium]